MDAQMIAKKNLILSGVAVVICLTIGGAALVLAQDNKGKDAKDGKDSKAPATAKAALTVTTVKPQQQSWPLKLAANGNITAWQEASVGAEVNGLRLTDVRVNVGDFVRKGQVLASFAADTVQADTAQARAAVAEAEASLAEAQANAERARALQASGALSAQQINQLLTGERTAQARLQSAKAAYASQSVRLKQTQLRAPDDGVISARMATVGAVVGAGQELFRLIRKNRLEWRAEVTSSELSRVKPGAAAALVTPAGETVQGKVRIVAPTIDPQTRNALVYVDLPVGSPAKAGMFARGEFELGAANALTVPQQALVLRDGFTYVFSVDANNRVQQRKVTVGRRNGDRIEVIEGLPANQALVATGAAFLADGDTVRITSAEAAPAASASAKPAASAARGTADAMGGMGTANAATPAPAAKK
jgi:RND family efflux transporter MFP subunit